MNLKHVELHGLCVYSLESIYYIYTYIKFNKSFSWGRRSGLWMPMDLSSATIQQRYIYIGNYILITCISVWYKLTLNMYDVAL